MSSSGPARRIAMMVANSGVEQVELTGPRDALVEAGATVDLLAPTADDIQAMTSDVNEADTFTPDRTVSQLDVEEYDLLVLPGGTTNADTLRLDEQAVDVVRRFVQARKPIAAICPGPWLLVEADVLQGKTLTSWPSLRTDITNAGGAWIDEPAVICPRNDWTLITSRGPDDIDNFNQAILDLLAG